jgi:hypothetical protein
VGRLAAGLTGAVCGDTTLVAAMSMATMLVAVMGAERGETTAIGVSGRIPWYCDVNPAPPMRPEGASEPAIGVFSVADEFNFDNPLGLEDRIHNTVIPLHSDAVTTHCTLEFFAPLRKGIKREILHYTESPLSNVLRKPGYVLFDRTAIRNLPFGLVGDRRVTLGHTRICGTAFL